VKLASGHLDSGPVAQAVESSGQANRVNISARTHQIIKDFVACESRGLVTAKDGRALEMYFAQELRAEVADPAVFVERYRLVFSEKPRVQPAVDSGTRAPS
jgi:hypothetical protein